MVCQAYGSWVSHKRLWKILYWSDHKKTGNQTEGARGCLQEKGQQKISCTEHSWNNNHAVTRNEVAVLDQADQRSPAHPSNTLGTAVQSQWVPGDSRMLGSHSQGSGQKNAPTNVMKSMYCVFHVKGVVICACVRSLLS